jgi:drug/metabolite transporter (DMT)-like permease
MAAVLLACLAGAAFGALAVTVRVGLRHGATPEVAPAAISLLACALSATAAAAFGQLGGLVLEDVWRFAAIGAVVPGLSQILFVRAVRDAGPSRAAVLIGAAPIFSAVLAVAFLDEDFGAALAVGTLLVVVGGAALAWERSRPAGFRVIGAVLALVCALLFAVRDNAVRAVARDVDVPPLAATTASLLGASIALVAVVALLARGRGVPSALGRATVPFLPAAVCLAVAYGALLEAFDRGPVTVVAPLNATQSLWAVGIAAVVLGATEAINRRLVVAALLVVAGGVIVGVSR